MSVGAKTDSLQSPAGRSTGGIVGLLATATGLCVANLYYGQPLLDAIGRGLHTSSSTAALLITLTQAGYAAGLLLLLPLGDLVNRARFVPLMALTTAVALAAMALAPSAPLFLTAATVAGVGASTAQVLVPFATELAPPHHRGRVVGTIAMGLLLGSVLARTVAGYLADFAGWRTVYGAAAVAMALLALVLRLRMPVVTSSSERIGYGALLASTFRIIGREPVLRVRMMLGGLSFAGFSVLWTALTMLLSGAPYHYSVGTIGLFGLLGAVGSLVARPVGTLTDQGRGGLLTTLSCLLLAVSWVVLFFGDHHIVPIIIGAAVFTLAVQGLQVANQSRIYQLNTGALSRVNSAYMTAYFIGGAIGSALTSAVYAAGEWSGVCVLGLALGLLTVLVWAFGSRAERRRPAPPTTSGATARRSNSRRHRAGDGGGR
ncbi:MFS transporter [Streptomyces sp. NBC_01378]|uniref:MFS transporter n=1 Tax=Streptomyces sp. NBC_01378 TaxID=2903844 RepID=UPI003249C701